ncbi:MAG: hypothetical protein ABW090_16930 [Sedimenticola sp.]
MFDTDSLWSADSFNIDVKIFDIQEEDGWVVYESDGNQSFKNRLGPFETYEKAYFFATLNLYAGSRLSDVEMGAGRAG